MMNNLFMMFDPSTNFLSLNWLTMFLPLIFFVKPFFLYNNRISFTFEMFYNLIKKDLKTNLKKKHLKTSILLMIIFVMICTLNLMSLLPFIFAPTSHIILTIFLSTPLWLSFSMKMFLLNNNNFMTHLVPMNTPMFLVPFMVIIETVSMMIRPITLFIRLTANMIAGHVLICLLSQMLNTNIYLFFITSLILNILMLLEMSVSLIQGYVFTTLLSLYIEETN